MLADLRKTFGVANSAEITVEANPDTASAEYFAALAEAAKLARLEEGQYGVSYVEKPLSPFEEFVVNMGGQARLQGLVRLLAPTPLLLDRETMARVEGELRWLESKGRTPYRAVAHCLCDY